MQKLNDYLNTYTSFHTNKANRMTHYFGIPMIIIALIMALNWIAITVGYTRVISFSWILVIASLVFYFRLHFKLALLTTIIMIPITLILNMLSGTSPDPVVGFFIILLFAGGWILQLWGHHFEQKKPAFMTGAVQLLIGPLFFILELLDILGLKDQFKDIDTEHSKTQTTKPTDQPASS